MIGGIAFETSGMERNRMYSLMILSSFPIVQIVLLYPVLIVHLIQMSLRTKNQGIKGSKNFFMVAESHYRSKKGFAGNFMPKLEEWLKTAK